MPALEQRIYTLVEQAREKIAPQAHPLKLDPELIAAARGHSQDMAARHYMAHRSPDGETSVSIIMAHDADFEGLVGENIAAQYYTKDGGVDPDAYAQRFVETWLDSKTHRENLTYPDYSRTGVGAAVNGDTVYVTQLFAAKLDAPPPKPAKAKKDRRTVTAYPDPKSANAGKAANGQ